MFALTYHGSHDVHIDTVPDPVLQAADDIIVRVTASAISGADLHLYRGRVAGLERGTVLGHEFMGVVQEAGPEVTRVRPGDRVVVPCVIACGQCHFCAMQLFACCETSNPAPAGKASAPGAARFGFGQLYGGVPGGQAEYVRVPHANVGPLRIPSDIDDERVLLLAETVPAAYQAVLNAGLMPGDSVAIFGAGPVGLSVAACARLAGAEKLFMVDHLDYRLEFAQQAYGVMPINFARIDDPVALIRQETGGRGADAAIDAVGFEAQGSLLENALTTLRIEASNGHALRQCLGAVRCGGTVSVPGRYAGLMHGFQLGEAFEKGLSLRFGLAHAQRFLPKLLQLVERGELRPQEIVTHRLPLMQAAEGYRLFDEKRDGCRKVVLLP